MSSSTVKRSMDAVKAHNSLATGNNIKGKMVFTVGESLAAQYGFQNSRKISSLLGSNSGYRNHREFTKYIAGGYDEELCMSIVTVEERLAYTRCNGLCILDMAYSISRLKGDEPQELGGLRKCLQTCMRTRMCSAEADTNNTPPAESIRPSLRVSASWTLKAVTYPW